MDTYTRLAIEAVVAGLRKSGAINDAAVSAIAEEIDAAAEQMASYDRDKVDAMRALATHVRAGRVMRALPD